MTFSYGEGISGLQSGAINSNLLKALSTNPFWAALVITIILMLIVMITFRNTALSKNDGLFKLLLRTGIYTYGAVLAIMYCHNYYMEQKYTQPDTTNAPNISGSIGYGDLRVPGLSGNQPAQAPITIAQQPAPTGQGELDKDGLPSFTNI